MNAELSAEQETSRIIQFFSGLSFKCIWKLQQLKNMLLHQRSPGGGGIWSLKMDLIVVHLNAFLARGRGIWPTQIPKVQMPRELPGGVVEPSIWPVHY